MEKLSNAERNRLLARSLFVDSEKGHKEIALILGVTEKTVGNYQTTDKRQGYDWLTLRTSKHIQESTQTKENMYSMFTKYMYDTLKEIREDVKMESKVKAQMIVSLGDSFSKMGKVASKEDPESYKYSIIKHVLEKVMGLLKTKLDQKSMEILINTIHDNQEAFDVVL